MYVRRMTAAALATAALVLAPAGVGSATASPAHGTPCGFYETGSDAFYNHCTSDRSNIVIRVEVAWAPDYDQCVGPGRSWLGPAGKIDGAYYTGRLC